MDIYDTCATVSGGLSLRHDPGIKHRPLISFHHDTGFESRPSETFPTSSFPTPQEVSVIEAWGTLNGTAPGTQGL